MQSKKDLAQYGNERGLSITHYLVKMINTILTALDDNTNEEAKAVIVQRIDWKGAFDRQCHKLGVRAFIENGARKSLMEWDNINPPPPTSSGSSRGRT